MNFPCRRRIGSRPGPGEICLGFCGAVALGAVLTGNVAAQDLASVEQSNTDVIGLFIELHQVSGTDEILEEFQSPGYRQLRAEFQNLATNADDSELSNLSEPIQTALADRQNTVLQLIADGDMVGASYRIQATHRGSLFGIPATGKSIEIEAVALFKISEGLVQESWFMADEADLLQQLEVGMPARRDGRRIAPDITAVARDGNVVLSEISENPADTQAYRNKIMVAAYKSATPPPGILPDRPGRPYDEYLRSGFKHLSERGAGIDKGELSIGQAFPDRRDKIGQVLAEGDNVFIQFRLFGTNTGSLFGMPPSNRTVDVWEVGIMEFDGDRWKTGWFFGDDLGMLLQIGGSQDFLFPTAK